MDSRTDADIIRASQKEPSNFALIFERHYEAIFRFAARRLGMELADDVAADTFVIALRRIQSYDTDYSSALPWLYGIVRNVIKNHWFIAWFRANSRSFGFAMSSARLPAACFSSPTPSMVR